MGNSLGSSNSSDLLNLRNSRTSLATSRESVSRNSFVTRDRALAETAVVVPRRQRRRQSTRRNDAVLLSLSRLIVETGRHADWVQVNDSWDEQKVETLVEAKLLAPRQQGLDEPFAEYQEECPICFYFYSQVNRSSCCNKPICTNCFVYIQRKIRKKCPYCNKWGLEVYLPKHSCSNDTKIHETQKWSSKDKESLNVDWSSLSNCTSFCEKDHCIHSSSDVEKLEEIAILLLLRKAYLLWDWVACGELDSQKKSCHKVLCGEQVLNEYSLIDTSESIESSCDISLDEQLYNINDMKEDLFEDETQQQSSETSILERSRYKSSIRSMDENLLDSLALATSSSAVSSEVSSMECFERREDSNICPRSIDELNDKSLFHIEENEEEDMFLQLFKVERSYDSSVRLDSLIHLPSDEEKET
ncbi:hypothetical protein Gasu_59040 isoform 1 [Galdieria sulphuraria]|uniref:RING-type domain-containing protein n=1 Tax=Galdieria sulphuraria TaxID=130081 RepID=M2VTH4_GALSU|nr:hypothetical protein Gasu_59040 isoform 1 [Galdieria sulphuraria]EME26501.1 hypothetical protein isoform 1 [Galdieria sulphuraria]|eukprot:XP_005703021.1 hypothetical protein isoform 1 [Galdieria sulphuraria]